MATRAAANALFLQNPVPDRRLATWFDRRDRDRLRGAYANQIFALQSAGYDIVTYEPRRSVPWGPRDVVVILIGVVAIVNLCTLSVAWLTKHPKEPHDLAAETSEPAHDASNPVVPDTTPEETAPGPKSRSPTRNPRRSSRPTNFA